MFQQFIHVSRYARWLDEEQRRETWEETVSRYMDFMEQELVARQGYVIPATLKTELTNAILEQKVLPSMRALMTAGPALIRDNVAGYNCSYLPIDDLRSLDELMYILMCGTGVGYSVERKYVNKLPTIPSFLSPGPTIVVEDSREGWSHAFRLFLESLFNGQMPSYDTSKLRPAGARLKTFGGRSSGPEPLEDLFRYTQDLVWGARGRKLTPLEVHDLCCKIGEVVVVGGVRRSALISLTDLDDHELATAKSGQWWKTTPHRSLANISVAYEERPSRDDFDTEWFRLQGSGSGERGIFNREAARKQVASIGRDENYEWGTNPCSEIILRPYQFCNLTSIVVRAEDTVETLAEKARLATILGTFQAALTNFPYLRDIWRHNTEEERLLGVSMTGQFGNSILSGASGNDLLRETLGTIREVTRKTNNEFADAIGIARSAAITCVKPEGTSSNLVYASSGMHAWHSEFFLRRVRGDKKDPLAQMMRDAGIPWEQDVMNPEAVVFTFPMAAPEGAITRHDLTAIQHLEIWLAYQEAWCDHKPSITVSIRQEEWPDVQQWVWKHFNKISGIAFLPFSDHTYQQAPFEDITQQQYLDALSALPEYIDWQRLELYEFEDTTTGVQTLNCTAGACEIVDIGQGVAAGA